MLLLPSTFMIQLNLLTKKTQTLFDTSHIDTDKCLRILRYTHLT